MSSPSTRVVRIRRKNTTDVPSVVVQDCDVYIGRRCTQGGWNLKDSKWANPYPAKQWGRDKCLELYHSYILKKIEEDPTTYNLQELVGKSLGCFCTPERCHGDILVEIMKGKGLL